MQAGASDGWKKKKHTKLIVAVAFSLDIREKKKGRKKRRKKRRKKMIDGIQCKRCGQADTFDVLCVSCDNETSDRICRFFNLAKAAQEKGQQLSKKPQDQIDVERVIKCGREWEGYMHLAKLQNQMFYDNEFMSKQVEHAVFNDPSLFKYIGRDQ